MLCILHIMLYNEQEEQIQNINSKGIFEWDDGLCKGGGKLEQF